MPASTEFTLLVAGIHDVTGGPVVQWEDEIPDIQVARLHGCRDAAKSFTELLRNWRSQGVCHPFSGMETNNIWSPAYTFFPSTIVPILCREINTEKEGLMTGGGEEVRERVCVCVRARVYTCSST